VQIVTSSGQPIESTRINFVSQQVDTAIRAFLVKAPLHSPSIASATSNCQARVVWSTAPGLRFQARGCPHRWAGVRLRSHANDKGMVASSGQSRWRHDGNDYAVLGGLQPGEKKSSFPARSS